YPTGMLPYLQSPNLTLYRNAERKGYAFKWLNRTAYPSYFVCHNQNCRQLRYLINTFGLVISADLERF
ncbi:hypothetical protein ACFSJH_01390, partial [Paenibacillus yanchengensis]